MMRRTRYDPRRPGSAPGFTLIEVLIALALSVILAGLLFSALHTYALSATTGHKHVAEKQTNESILHFVRNQLRTVVPLRLGTTRNREVLFYGDQDRIIYVGRIPSHRSAGGLHRNALVIRDENEHTAMTFNYSRLVVNEDFDMEAFVAADFDSSRILLEGTAAISFEYFGRPETDKDAEWQGRWDRIDQLPELIRITIGEESETGRPTELIVRLYTHTASRHIAMTIGHPSNSSFGRGVSDPSGAEAAGPPPGAAGP